MAIVALQSAASGLSALNTALDVTSNNLANINTPGFKASRPNFQDLLYIERQAPGVENASTGDQRPTGLYVGLGTRVSSTQLDFTAGSPLVTNRDLDVAIDGSGFFRVRTPDAVGGGFAYTRAGNLTLNSNSELVLASDTGRRLEPVISIPAGASRPIEIARDGTVSVRIPPALTPTVVGTLEITAFLNPQGLRPVGDNLFVETDASGPPLTGQPGTEQRGELIQNAIEGSNVDPTRELIELIKTQRAFEMNSNTIRAADAALQTVSNLRR